jgi:hypothetical protein
MNSHRVSSNKFSFSKFSVILVILIIISTLFIYNIYFTKKNYKLKRRNAMTEDEIKNLKNIFAHPRSKKNLKE